MLKHHSFAKKGNEYAGQMPIWKGWKLMLCLSFQRERKMLFYCENCFSFQVPLTQSSSKGDIIDRTSRKQTLMFWRVRSKLLFHRLFCSFPWRIYTLHLQIQNYKTDQSILLSYFLMATFLVMTSMKWETMDIKSIFKHFLNRDGDKNKKPGSTGRKIANFPLWLSVRPWKWSQQQELKFDIQEIRRQGRWEGMELRRKLKLFLELSKLFFIFRKPS